MLNRLDCVLLISVMDGGVAENVHPYWVRESRLHEGVDQVRPELTALCQRTCARALTSALSPQLGRHMHGPTNASQCLSRRASPGRCQGSAPDGMVTDTAANTHPKNHSASTHDVEVGKPCSAGPHYRLEHELASGTARATRGDSGLTRPVGRNVGQSTVSGKKALCPDEAVAVGATCTVCQGAAQCPPNQGANAGVHDILQQNILGVLEADAPGLQQSKPALHRKTQHSPGHRLCIHPRVKS
jgi:hypothetical protein